jgi:tetratricopeptide (TPR) repeat protein
VRDESGDTTRAAMDRLLDHYRHTASLAMDAVYPHERDYRPHVPPAHTPGPELVHLTEAVDWLDGELPNLLAAARYATEHDRPAHLQHLSTVLHRHLCTRDRFDHAETLHQQALTAARATGDPAAERDALIVLGHTHRRLGRYEPAAEHYRQALELARSTATASASWTR